MINAGLIEAECRAEIESAKSLDEKIDIAFNTAKDHWMFTDESSKFQGALGVLLMHTEGEDKERVEQEIESIAFFNAMLSGIPVNLDAAPEMENPIGLMKKWKALNKRPETND